MLGRLMKYEWKATWKLLAPANLLIVVTSFFAWLTWRCMRYDGYDMSNAAVNLAAGILLVTYFLSMFVVIVGSAIYLIWRFYTSTYGDQGYLLHTLPVDKHHIIIAKVLVSTAWILLSIFLMYLSLFLVVGSTMEEFGTVFQEILKIVVTQSYGDTGSAFVVVMGIITMIVGMLARVLKVTAAISLGQLSSNHKLLTAFGFYYAIYIVQQIIGAIYGVVVSYFTYRAGDGALGMMWEFNLITGLVYMVVFYALTWYVMEKRLNLD